MTTGDNNFNYFPENQLTKFSARVSTAICQHFFLAPFCGAIGAWPPSVYATAESHGDSKHFICITYDTLDLTRLGEHMKHLCCRLGTVIFIRNKCSFSYLLITPQGPTPQGRSPPTAKKLWCGL